MMDPSAEAASRRQFFKSLPDSFVKGIRSVADCGLIPWLDPKKKNESKEVVGVARIARVDVARCHAWIGALCQQCYIACPKRDDAIEMRDQKPVIITSVCDGCAMCEVACKTISDHSAIDIVPLEDHTQSQRAVKEVSP